MKEFKGNSEYSLEFQQFTKDSGLVASLISYFINHILMYEPNARGLILRFPNQKNKYFVAMMGNMMRDDDDDTLKLHIMDFTDSIEKDPFIKKMDDSGVLIMYKKMDDNELLIIDKKGEKNEIKRNSKFN